MQEKLEGLYALKLSIESKAFQDSLVKPIYEELDKLKGAYDCKTVEELARIKGKKEGLKFFIDLLKLVDLDIKNTKYELDSQV